VAMTGGQPVGEHAAAPGSRTASSHSVAQIAQSMRAEGAVKIIVVTDEPEKYEDAAIASRLAKGVTVHHRDDLDAIGAVEAFMRVKRAGFKPTLNLLYSIEGALRDCHWQEITDVRRSELVLAADAAIALLPPPRHRPVAGPVRTTVLAEDTVAARPDENAPVTRSYGRPPSQN